MKIQLIYEWEIYNLYFEIVVSVKLALFICLFIILYLFYLWLFTHSRASSVLVNCYQWEFCFPCETSIKKTMELALIRNFHNQSAQGGLNSRSFDPKINTLNHLAIDP